MRAVAAVEPGVLRLVDIPVPECGEYECLLRTESSGFCSSTDMKIIEGDLHNASITYPLILGHEGVGRVVEMGNKVRNAGIGDRYIHSTSRIAEGTQYRAMWGGMAEYAIMRDIKAMVEDGMDPTGGRHIEGLVPEEITSIDAASLLTVEENFSALKNFGLNAGDSVLIYGDGAVGFGLANLARIMGAGFVACVGHHDDRLEKIKTSAKADVCTNARTADVTTSLDGREFGLVIDAVGKSRIILEGARLLKPGGKIGAYGVLHRDDADINLLDLPNHVQLHMLNFPYREFATHDDVVAMVLEKTVDLKDYYSHVMPVEQCAEAMELVKSRQALKVVFEF